MYVLGFLEGACAHLLDLIRGGMHAYASFQQVPLQVFLVGLTVLDPLVAVLVVLVRKEGVRLAGTVMVLDVCANWWGNRHWLHDDSAQLLPLLPITLFGLFVVGSVLPLSRTLVGKADRPQEVMPPPSA